MFSTSEYLSSSLYPYDSTIGKNTPFSVATNNFADVIPIDRLISLLHDFISILALGINTDFTRFIEHGQSLSTLIQDQFLSLIFKLNKVIKLFTVVESKSLKPNRV